MYTHKFNVFANIVYPVQIITSEVITRQKQNHSQYTYFCFHFLFSSHFYYLCIFLLCCRSIFPWYPLRYTKFRNGGLVGGFAISSDGYFWTPLTSLFLNKAIKCCYAFSYLDCKEHFGNKIILIWRNFLFLSLKRFTCLKVLSIWTSTLRSCFVWWRTYDVRSAHWRVNNKIKIKFTLLQWIP